MNEILRAIAGGLILIIFLSILYLRKHPAFGRVAQVFLETRKTIESYFKDHPNYGLGIAFFLFPLLFCLMFELSFWSFFFSYHFVIYGLIAVAAIIVSVPLRFKGESGRRILGFIYVMLIIFAVGNLVFALTGSQEPMKRVVSRFEPIRERLFTSLDHAPELNYGDLRRPRVMRDIGVYPHLGHRYTLDRGWNTTLAFKLIGEAGYMVNARDVATVVRFEGYEDQKPKAYERFVEASRKGVEIPGHWNGRLFVYSPSAGAEFLVYTIGHDFLIDAAESFLQRDQFGPDIVNEGTLGRWEVVARNPRETFDIPSLNLKPNQVARLFSSGPLIWVKNRGIEQTIGPGEWVELTFAQLRWFKFRTVGQHDVHFVFQLS